jgi:DNA polymerase III epsilon subunit-like protein
MIIIDTETTGTDPRVHSLLSIGAVEYENPTNRFYGECRAFEGAHISAEALAVCGFSQAEATDPEKQSEEALLRSFYAWVERVGEATFGGQNPSFDRDFIRMAAERAGMAWPYSYRTVDLHSIIYAKLLAEGKLPAPQRRHTAINLDTGLGLAGLSLRTGAHNALEDALLEAEVFSRLVESKPLLPEYAAFPLVSGR